MARRDLLRMLAAGPLLAYSTEGGAAQGPESAGITAPDPDVLPEALAEEHPAGDRPNILLIHCHDLGQFLHCYGVETVQTPNLDKLAAEGVRFSNSFCTAPQCSPSRASIFTGRYPHCTGVMGLTHANFGWDLHPDERHLGQILKEAGYRTAGVGVLHETHSGPARCGLDDYVPKPWAKDAADAAIDQLELLNATGDSPWYLQVGFLEPHRLPQPDPEADHRFTIPGIPPDDSLGISVPGYLDGTQGTRQELAELQGLVRHMDEQASRLLDALEVHGLRENTLIIFTTDHGIAMPRAKCSLYDPGLEVAFILRLPSRPGWHGGKVHDAMIQNIDYVPTLRDLLGLPAEENLHGRSFAPLLDGRHYTPYEEIFGEITYHDYYDPRRCIRTHTHKLIVNFTTAPFFMDPSQSWRPLSEPAAPPNNALTYHPYVELYDLREDPWELQNLADDAAYADVQHDLLNRLYLHMERTEDPLLAGAVTPPAHIEALQQLRGKGGTDVKG